jgi:fumarate reductase subunit D
MKKLLLTLEPIIWLMFGQGILLGTMLLTGWVLVVGLAIPLGFVDASALSYERAHALASGSLLGIPIGPLVVAAIIALPLWKGAHHVRSLLLDFGGEARDGTVGGLLYLVALVGSIGAILAVVRL